MRSVKNIAIMVALSASAALLLCGCGNSTEQIAMEESEIVSDEEDTTSAEVSDDLKEEQTEEATEKTTENATEELTEEPTEEPFVNPVKINYDALIDEKTALDMVYNHLYEDSAYKGYGVYIDANQQDFGAKQAYVVAQFPMTATGNKFRRSMVQNQR